MSAPVAILSLVQIVVLIVGYTMLVLDEDDQIFGIRARNKTRNRRNRNERD